MATSTSIFGIVNDTAKSIYGKQAVKVVDTTSLVSLGDTVLSSDTSVDVFYKKLFDRIGRTVVVNRNYAPVVRKVMKQDLEWGIALQKISFAMQEASSNPAWVDDSQASPYDIPMQTVVIQKLFSTMTNYDFSNNIPSYQLFTAFTNEAAMGAFIAGIYSNQSNALKVAEENLANAAVNTNMAVCLKSGNTTQARNLLAEYNTTFTATLTVDTALVNRSFLEYATKELLDATEEIQKMGVLFNDKSRPVFTPPDKMVVEVLAKFANFQTSYLRSYGFHKEFTELPAYEKVTCWQATGTDSSFANRSSIKVKHDFINKIAAVEQSGIIAFIHDEDSCGSIITRHRAGSLYNGYAERLNFWDHADKGFYVDSSENAIVFYIADPVTP